MALPTSSLSVVGRSIVDFIADRLDATQNNLHVGIGNPAEIAPQEGDTDHRLGVFFYGIEPGGYDADGGPGEPWLVRLHCLITAFGVLEDQISSGENDLRLLGEVVRIFHETPILDALDVDGEITRTRVIFQQLSLDEVNQIWSTQHDVSYRPSVAYEIALIPIVPSERTVESPLAGSLGFEVHASEAGRTADFGGTAHPPTVARFAADPSREDWAPRMAFIHEGAYTESLAFEVGSPELSAFSPLALIAGESGTTVSLAWEIWDTTDGWRPDGTPVDVVIDATTIEPDNVNLTDAVTVNLPFTDRGGQAMLHARRSFQRSGDGATIIVRSNPLLVSLFEVAP